MEDDEYVVYIGEDVRHGGYYLITDGIYKKFGPKRIIDFPPDETTLLGCALGFSQLGILPIVEIPYIKYFDCGIDIFYEIAIQYWLTNGNSSSTSTISSIKSSSSSSSSTIGEGGEGEGKCEDDSTSNNKVGGGGGGIRDEGSSQPILPKRRNGGMIIRLQGFDRGVFGGNFHTHNSLSHIPPGVDVVCYSNGPDYVRGMRYAHYQAKYSGRIIVFVDCTYILNLRHVHNSKNGGGGDRAWEFPYPSLYDDSHGDHDLVGNDDYNGHDDYDPMTRNNDKQNSSSSMIDFDQVIRYRVGHEDHPFIRDEIGSTYSSNDDNDDGDDAPSTSTSASTNDNAKQTRTRTRKVAIVTYGNGVVTSLQARKSLLERNSQDNVLSISNDEKLDIDIDIDIIDCPYLSDVPKGLENIICDYDYILFADICKEGPGSNIFSSMITTLQQKRRLLSTSRWQFIGAPRTYNPLGSTVTFLNQDRIEDAVIQMLKDA